MMFSLVTFQQQHDCITAGVQDRTGFSYFLPPPPSLFLKPEQARSPAGDAAPNQCHPEHSPLFFPFRSVVFVFDT